MSLVLDVTISSSFSLKNITEITCLGILTTKFVFL